MDDHIELRTLEFNIRYKEVNPNFVVGHCLELPFIIARGKDVDEFTREVKKYLVHFINTFPDKMNSIVLKYSKTIEEYDTPKDLSNEKWIIKPLYT